MQTQNSNPAQFWTMSENSAMDPTVQEVYDEMTD
jgi:hypothetical protein